MTDSSLFFYNVLEINLENFTAFDCFGRLTTVIMKVIDLKSTYQHQKPGKVSLDVFKMQKILNRL